MKTFSLSTAALLCLSMTFLGIPQISHAATVSVTELTEFIASGDATYEGDGTNVASAGDVNGDGYDDFLIGADTNNAVYLVYGAEDLLTSSDLSAAAEFTGETAGDSVGYSVASAGDVNGDGYDDFLIGAFLNDNSAGNAGIVYLVYGSATPYSGTTALSDSSITKFTGEGASDLAGWAVASARDVNNDGYDDFLIGAKGRISNAGSAYLVYGKIGGFATETSISLSEIDTNVARVIEFSGESVGDLAGYSVASAGDVNGDNFDDFLIGAISDDDGGSAAGAVYLVYGSESPLTNTTLAVEVKFTGEAASDAAGSAVSSAGDVNADGYSDFLVSAYLNDDGGTSAGAVYLYYGDDTSLASGSLGDVGPIQFTGQAAGDTAGWSVSPGGDVNSDGYDDFIIGAPGNNTTASDAGLVYLLYGEASALNSTHFAFDIFTGALASDTIGQSAVSVDLNGDGRGEMLLRGDALDPLYVGYLYVDGDSDGIPSTDGVFDGTDCDDTDPDGYITYYADVDSDTLGDPSSSVCAADPAPAGYVLDSSDENDLDYDNDGYDSLTDCDDNDNALTVTYFLDSDGDGFGGTDPASCEQIDSSWILDSSDDNDANTTVYPDAPELEDGLDNNQDGTIDEGTDAYDDDADGMTENAGDCNDSDSSLTSNITYYIDVDGDGLGSTSSTTSLCSLTVPDGYVSNSSDTNDSTDVTPDETGSHEETEGIDTPEELQNETTFTEEISSIVGSTEGNIVVTYTDSTVYTYNIFPKYHGSSLTKVKVFTGSGYLLVLQPKGKKIALVNPYTGEVIERVRLSKKIKYKKNSLKLLDVRHDGSLNIVVTSKKEDKVRVSLLKLNTSTGNLTKKDYEKLTGASDVKVKNTTAPKKKIVLKDSSKNILYTFKVGKKYLMTME